jgi:flagellar biosynthesis/type III secretory pathway M-ring protein FliF/YscJ
MTYQEVDFNLDTRFPASVGDNPFEVISDHNKTAMKELLKDAADYAKKTNYKMTVLNMPARNRQKDFMPEIKKLVFTRRIFNVRIAKFSKSFKSLIKKTLA